MRRTALLTMLALASIALAAPTAGAARRAATRGHTYLVLFKQGTSAQAAQRAVRRAGGHIVRYNGAVGLATVRTNAKRFRSNAAAQAAVQSTATNRRIGHAPRDKYSVERTRGGRFHGHGTRPRHNPVTGDPFSPIQWDMQLIHATPDGSYRYDQGSHAVRVGIIDTGIDGTHPDIAPNFDSRLSRNFSGPDDPVIDGPCAEDLDGSCAPDPANVDEDGHGTHVAGTVGAALNGIGMAGVAPRVDLVNLRAGHDSGYFFLQATVDAITYAADHGIDVVNMSFYTDPWLFNCPNNPADSPAEQADQRTVLAASDRALRYAHQRGVTLIAAEGNENTDLGHPTSDDTSPDYPPDAAHDRTIDNGCRSEPSEGPFVINVSSVGPSTRKAYYSNYGVEQTDVAAPGGDRRDFFGTDKYNDPKYTRILAPYPKYVGIAEGNIDPDTGDITPDGEGFVLRDGDAYYQYLQGTSMAAPHAVGVAALIVDRFGHRDPRHGGLTLNPNLTEFGLKATATPHDCPAQNPFTYPDPDLGPEYTAFCQGNRRFNGFYGFGIVDALRAATAGHGHYGHEREHHHDRR